MGYNLRSLIQEAHAGNESPASDTPNAALTEQEEQRMTSILTEKDASKSGKGAGKKSAARKIPARFGKAWAKKIERARKVSRSNKGVQPGHGGDIPRHLSGSLRGKPKTAMQVRAYRLLKAMRSMSGAFSELSPAKKAQVRAAWLKAMTPDARRRARITQKKTLMRLRESTADAKRFAIKAIANDMRDLMESGAVNFPFLLNPIHNIENIEAAIDAYLDVDESTAIAVLEAGPSAHGKSGDLAWVLIERLAKHDAAKHFLGVETVDEGVYVFFDNTLKTTDGLTKLIEGIGTVSSVIKPGDVISETEKATVFVLEIVPGDDLAEAVQSLIDSFDVTEDDDDADTDDDDDVLDEMGYGKKKMRKKKNAKSTDPDDAVTESDDDDDADRFLAEMAAQVPMSGDSGVAQEPLEVPAQQPIGTLPKPERKAAAKAVQASYLGDGRVMVNGEAKMLSNPGILPAHVGVGSVINVTCDPDSDTCIYAI